jgi:Family of unknown function (DUF5906)/RepB DNA-primase from phage plasmid
MNNDPRHIQGGAAGAEGVDQQKKSTTPPPNEQSQERANGAAHAEVYAHVEMLHRLAEPLRDHGKLIIASFGQAPITGQHIRPKVLHFDIGDIDGMVEQIELLSREQHRNVYVPLAVFFPNLPLGKKGSEQQMVASLGLVGDFDDDDAGNYAGRMPVPANYVIETSSDRFQVFLLFDESAEPGHAKQLARSLKDFSGCDHGTADISHVWRIPGTLNWPNKKKVDQGRRTTPQLVNIVQPWNGSLTALKTLEDALTAAEQGKGGPDGENNDDTSNGGERKTNGSGGEHREGTIPTELMKLIRDGVERGHRSDKFFRAVAWLKQLGWTIDGTTALFEKYPKGIAAKYTGRIRVEVERVYKRVDEHSSDAAADVLAQLNEKYCVMQDGGRVRVLTFERYVRKARRRQHVRHVPTFLSFEDFRNLHRHKRVADRGKFIQRGHWWLDNPRRRQYAGITFEPGGAKVIDDKLNLWCGWGVEPQQGDWSLMQDHIFKVLASGIEEVATYIFDWLAWAVQHPDERAEVALVFIGKRGTGKGTLGNAMCRLFAQHAVHISSSDHLAGRFNFHLRDACLLFADEAYWPGDKSAEGTLKRMITEPELFIEGKNRDAVTTRNMLHVLMASNEGWVVPAGERERRFAVFNVSECHLQDEKWFTPLYEQLEDGGYAAMLFDLLHRDLGGFHPRRLPKTIALREQQRQGLQPCDAWWVELLEAGVLEGADPNAPNCAVSNGYDREVTESDGYGLPRKRRIRQRGLYDQARAVEPRLRWRNDHALGHYLTEQGCDNSQKVLRRRGWKFPPLPECRKRWEARFPDWKWRDPLLSEWQCEQDEQQSEQDGG